MDCWENLVSNSNTNIFQMPENFHFVKYKKFNEGVTYILLDHKIEVFIL